MTSTAGQKVKAEAGAEAPSKRQATKAPVPSVNPWKVREAAEKKRKKLEAGKNQNTSSKKQSVPHQNKSHQNNQHRQNNAASTHKSRHPQHRNVSGRGRGRGRYNNSRHGRGNSGRGRGNRHGRNQNVTHQNQYHPGQKMKYQTTHKQQQEYQSRMPHRTSPHQMNQQMFQVPSYPTQMYSYGVPPLPMAGGPQPPMAMMRQVMNPSFPMYTVPPQMRATHFSIDVECVATGVGHNDREIAQIGVVDEFGNVLYNTYVKPEKKVVSYLTALTGITKEQLDAEGISLSDALASLKKILPNDAVLVGQNIAKDVKWCGLVEGTDFQNIIDLVGVFQVFNPLYNSFTKFSLSHVVKVLLGITDDNRLHNALEDARLSMLVYNAYRQIEAYNPMQLNHLHKLLLATPTVPSFARRNPIYEGVCQGYKKQCTCGQPFEY